MHVSNGLHSLKGVGLLRRVGLMHHSLIALPCGSGLVRINPGNNKDRILYLLLHGGQAVNVFTDRIFIVGGTRADDQKQAVQLS